MTVSLAIPGDGPLFAGHFPGRPILPGVAEIVLITRACAPQAHVAAVTAIPFARFRRIVLPGDTLQVSSDPRGENGVRFDARKEGALVANGALVFGSPEPRAAGTKEETVAPSRTAPIEALIPHRGPMRFVDEILAITEETAICRGRVPSACGLVADGVVPALVGLELAAQTAAVWEALRRSRASGARQARTGYLVSLREVAIHRATIRAGEALRAAVRLTAWAPPLAHYDVEIASSGALVLRGGIGTYLSA